MICFPLTFIISNDVFSIFGIWFVSRFSPIATILPLLIAISADLTIPKSSFVHRVAFLKSIEFVFSFLFNPYDLLGTQTVGICSITALSFFVFLSSNTESLCIINEYVLPSSFKKFPDIFPFSINPNALKSPVLSFIVIVFPFNEVVSFSESIL